VVAFQTTCVKWDGTGLLGLYEETSAFQAPTASAMEKDPVPAARFSPKGPRVPPEWVLVHSSAHCCAFAAAVLLHVRGTAPCWERTLLCAFRYAVTSLSDARLPLLPLVSSSLLLLLLGVDSDSAAVALAWVEVVVALAWVDVVVALAWVVV
jgi:hypothetical protein